MRSPFSLSPISIGLAESHPKWKETHNGDTPNFPRKTMITGGRGFIGETPRNKRSSGIISHCDPLFLTEVRHFCWVFLGRWDIIPAQNWPMNSCWSTSYHGIHHGDHDTRLDFAVLSVDWILVIVAWVLAGTEFNSDLFRASRLGSGGLKPPVVFSFSWFGWKDGFHRPSVSGNHSQRVSRKRWHQIGMLKNPKDLGSCFFTAVKNP